MFEEYYLEEKTKNFLKKGLILILICILVFVLVKIFILKPSLPSLPPEIPSLSPQDVVIGYFKLEQERKREEAEEHLVSYFSQVRILGEEYEKLRSSFWVQPKEKEGSLPEYLVKETKVVKSDANLTLEVITNKMEGSIFFNFRLPKKVVFKIVLWKINDHWKIIEIDSPDLVLESKLGEKKEIKENVFVEAIKIEDYILEIEYENRSTEPVSFYSFGDWKIVDKDGKIYYPIPGPDFEITQPMLPDIELDLGGKEKVSLSFGIPKDVLVKEVIFRNIDREIIFKID